MINIEPLCPECRAETIMEYRHLGGHGRTLFCSCTSLECGWAMWAEWVCGRMVWNLPQRGKAETKLLLDEAGAKGGIV